MSPFEFPLAMQLDVPAFCILTFHVSFTSTRYRVVLVLCLFPGALYDQPFPIASDNASIAATISTAAW